MLLNFRLPETQHLVSFKFTLTSCKRQTLLQGDSSYSKIVSFWGKKKKVFFHFVQKQRKLHYILAYQISCLFSICADLYSSLKKETIFKKYKVNTFY